MTDRVSHPSEIAAEIARLERRLRAIDDEREHISARLGELRRDQAAAPTITVALVAPSSGAPIPSSSSEKVSLFASLFRGRTDVYPRFWSNDRKGTKGYSPVCGNEWQRPLCQKPKVRCGECEHRAFEPVTSQVILDHLQGKHVIGVYPLLEDERCHLLAVDFDKTSWREDVAAFAETCQRVGVPAAVERSRSGNGAHAWFFFEEAVPASTARKLGCYLLTETMARCPAIGMDSYDRLFPNQDTMPRGGFGNLIALPLQHEARKQGNTVFLGEDLEPLLDQWAFLAGIRRIPSASVGLIAAEAERQGRVLGVRFAPAEDDAAPGARLPSGKPRTPVAREPAAASVTCVRANRFFVAREGLPTGLLTELRRAASFQNPEFYKKQAMRLSTGGTPRVVTCAADDGPFIALPRGCEPDARELLAAWGSEPAVREERVSGAEISVRFGGNLSHVQRAAAAAILPHEFGIVVAPPGTGKTVLAASLIAERGVSTLVLVHRKPLLDQWIAQLSSFLDVPKKEIGVIGGGKRKPTGRIDVAMTQSLVRRGIVNDLVTGYGHVVVDECHHVSAVSFERVLSEVKARYVLGLTATPGRRDGHDPIIEMQLGPVRYTFTAKAAALARGFRHRLLVRETGFVGTWKAGDRIQDLYASLANDEARNTAILDDVIEALEDGRSPLLLTERRDHLEFFVDKLRPMTRNLVALHGGLSPKDRREALQLLAEIPADEERLVVATGRYVGEGFDDPRLDTLVLALPVAWKGTVVQYAGRLHRQQLGKTEVRIHDYRDGNIPVLVRMFEKRLRGYRAMGYEPEQAGPGAAEREQVLDYVEDDT
jgi:superfamily II DNA or RNA helicase